MKSGVHWQGDCKDKGDQTVETQETDQQYDCNGVSDNVSSDIVMEETL